MGGSSCKTEQIYPYASESPGTEQDQKNITNLKVKMDGHIRNNRKPTDVGFLTVFTIFLTILGCLIGYCIYHGDINRVTHGYDNCGTVCGDPHRLEQLRKCYQTTDEINFGSYHIVVYKAENSRIYNRICTNNCSHFNGYKEFLNRCLPSGKKTIIDKFFTKTGLKEFFVEVSEDFEIYWKVFIYNCAISLVISSGFLLMFPFIAGILVWIILMGVTMACWGATFYLWMSWKELKDHQKLDSEIEQRKVYSYFGFAVTATCISVVVMLIIFVMIKRVKLVIQLFHEAGKAISAMPVILFEPFLTFFSLMLTICLWIYFCLWISSAGYLTEKHENIYFYKKDAFMETAKFLNFFGMFWMVQFIIGCQHVIIAGAVSKWYFMRDKSKLKHPITESFYNLTRYHLGTIATGSFLLSIIQILRIIMIALQKMMKNTKNSIVTYIVKIGVCFCQCCLWIIEHFLNLLSRNAYIITAMYGHSFYSAGKLAFNHLAANPLKVAAINSVGDFVLFLSKVLVVACSVAVASFFLQNKEGVQYVWVPLFFIGLFSYFISHCFMTVYEMTIDTIFICFCEDCELNDGISKPYFMPRGLMKFIENSKNDRDNRLPQMHNPELSSISKSVAGRP